MCAILCFCAICSPLMMCVQEQVRVLQEQVRVFQEQVRVLQEQLQEQLQVNVALYTICYLGYSRPSLVSAPAV